MPRHTVRGNEALLRWIVYVVCMPCLKLILVMKDGGRREGIALCVSVGTRV